MAMQTPTGQFLGIRLIVQCAHPHDPYYTPKNFMPVEREGGIRIGRAEDSDIPLQDTSVSGLHCRIQSTSGGFLVEDMGSRNGTDVGGYLLQSGETALLRDGDVIEISPYRITVRMGAGVFMPDPIEDPPHIESTAQLGHDMLQSMFTSEGKTPPTLRLLNGRQGQQDYPLKEYEDFIIGRAEHAHLCLVDEAVSREHAIIRRDWTGVTIRDLNSRNGVVVNGTTLRSQGEIELKHNDRIVIGSFQLLFLDPFAAQIAEKLDHIDGASVGDQESTLPPMHMNHAITGGFAKQPIVDEPVSGQWIVPKRSAPPSSSPSAPAPASPAASRPLPPLASQDPDKTLPPVRSLQPARSIPNNPLPSTPAASAPSLPSQPQPSSASSLPSSANLPRSPAPSVAPKAQPILPPPPPAGLQPAQRAFLLIGGFFLALLLGILAFLLLAGS